MKNKIKPIGILKAVSLYADGTSASLYVTGSVDWSSKKCNRALGRMATIKARIAKGTYKLPKVEYFPTGRAK